MDLATLIGLLGALGVIAMAIIMGGSASTFINIPSLLIVIGGTALATLIKYPLGHFLSALKVAVIAFVYKDDGSPQQLIKESVGLAEKARKEGLLALEDVQVSNRFLAAGIQMLADGQEAELVRRVLNRDINLTIERHERSERVFRAIGDVGPAMGMIGTLIGLVQMLSNMDDPKKIGPAMAIALLTTLYGAIIANVIALPIADKLAHRNEEEQLNRQLILESINAIQEGLNPRVMEDLLKVYLPSGMRDQQGGDADAPAEAA